MQSLYKEKIELCAANVEEKDIKDSLDNVDKKIAAALLQKQREVFEKELNDISEMKQNKGKAAASEAVVIKNPKTKADVVNPIGIKRVALDYCSDLLTNREPKEDCKEDINFKELMHQLRMAYFSDDDEDLIELTEEKCNKTYNILAKRPGSK